MGVVRGEARVFETRLPQNDYYARDSDPVVLPSTTAGQMQVVWSTNRASTGTATAVGSAAPAGTDPTDLPTSDSPSNLVYTTTRGLTGGPSDELYRLYAWTTGGAGATLPPDALTANGAGIANGQPALMYSPDGSAKWAFWHRSQRHAGGVESTLRFNSSEADLTTDWAAANENFIYASGLPKQGLRGFARPTGAWLFWHSGPPGREQLMYRWDFNGVTVNSNEAPVPVTNVAPAGQLSDLVNATLTDGTKAVIQRPSVGPFTYTKDVSVVPYNGAVNVFFSGFVTAEAQADICWSRFNLASMGPTSAVDNFAKLPFASITNWEEMQPDALRQKFGSRHLDWLVNRDFAATGPGPATGLNPRFILQLGFDSNVPPRPQRCFLVDWAEAPTAYDRSSHCPATSRLAAP